MANRGFLIRFIDIGLIVLFGFLMISEIEATSRVELAGGDAEVAEPIDLDEEGRAFLVVDLGPEGLFRVTDAETAAEGAEDPASGASAPARTQAELAAILVERRQAHQDAGLETVVLIQPHPASLVQLTVDVMDVCDRLSLQRSLRMDIQVEPSGGEGAANP